MDMPDLSLMEFWSGGGNHIAGHPLRMEEAAGLGALAVASGARGWCFFRTSGSEGMPKWVGLEKEIVTTSAQLVLDQQAFDHKLNQFFTALNPTSQPA